MSDKLQGRKIAFLATTGVEQVEFTEPWKAVEEAGGDPELVSLEPGEVQAPQHLEKGDTFEVDVVIADAEAGAYDALVLPGGVANPDFSARGRARCELRAGLLNAGGDWVDEEVVVDSGLVTSRRPDDLEAFCAKLVEEFCEGAHEEQAAKTA